MTSLILLADTQDRPSSTEALNHLKVISFDLRSRKEHALYAELIAIASHFAQSPSDYDAAEAALAHAVLQFDFSDHGQRINSLLMAQGSFKASRGQYAEALPIFERARLAAERRGSPSEVARAVANIMMSQMRLGRFEEILRLSPSTAKAVELQIDPTAFKILCYVALSHAIMGNASEALELVPKCLHSASQTPTHWASQACQLYVSDIHTILAKHRDATRYARLATSGQSSTPLSRSYIGPFSRAVAKVAIVDGSELDGLNRIELAESELECDLIDRAEIACAKIQLRGQIGEVPLPAIAALKGSLEGLPAGILTMLDRLGLGKCLEYASRPPQDEILLQHPL
jgi:tetratricopeptide (TPR) repeat protein